MRILYFAWIRTTIGIAEETVNLKDCSILQLIEYLCAKGEEYQKAFSELDSLCVAVNQEYCSFDTVLSGEEEVAFFPPVTGG